MSRKFDIAIIGAGVVGCSIAYYLCTKGVRNIALIDKEEFPGTGSTSKANGGIRAQFTSEINVAMSLLSMRLLEEMDDDMAAQCAYVKAGYLFMTADAERLKQLEKTARFQQAHGVAVDMVTREEIAAIVPFVKDNDLVGGAFGSRDGFIDPNGLTGVLFARAVQSGARFLRQTEVVGFIRQGNRICGCKTNHGEVFAEKTVNCAGPLAAAVAAMAGIDLPVQPVRRQVVLTGPVVSLPRSIPMTIDSDTSLIVRREGDSVSLSYSNPDEPAGYNLQFDPAFVEVIAPKMQQRFPILEAAGFDFSRCRAGCYEVSPDHHAILGESGVPGFYLANGFSGHGVMHAPAAGLAMAELLAEGKASSIDIASLSVRRFAGGRLAHETAVL